MTKEKKTAEELAAMILQDMSNVTGCPKRGVTVTVYGLNPWNSMLTLGSMPVPSQIRLSYSAFVKSSLTGIGDCTTLGLSSSGFRVPPDLNKADCLSALQKDLLRAVCFAVPELTRRANIKLNERV